MKSSLTRFAALAGAAVLGGAIVRTVVVASAPTDFGAWVQDQLQAEGPDLFGFEPLEKSAIGPYNGADNTKAIHVANGLLVSLVSSSSASATDQIAFWPDSVHP